MPKTKIRRKELKAPDEFLTWSRGMIQYGAGHRAVTTAVVAAAVIALGGFFAIRTYSGWRSAAAAEAFTHARHTFDEGKYAEAAEQFSAVHSRWPGTGAGRLSLVYVGASCVHTGQNDRAKNAYSELRDASDGDEFRQIASYNLGLLARQAGDAAAAREHLRTAASIDGPLQSAAVVALAAVGDPDGSAKTAFKHTREKLPQDLRAFVEDRLRTAAP
jgi:predicted negative regulator of RcsB-dependent stress response